MRGHNCGRFDSHHGPWNSAGDREVSPGCHGPPGHGHHDFHWGHHKGPHGHHKGHQGHHKGHHGHHLRLHDHHGHCHGPHGHPYHPHFHGRKEGRHGPSHHHGCGNHFGPHRAGPSERHGECQREFRSRWFWHGSEERRTRGCHNKDETVLVRGIVIERNRPHSV